MANNKQLAEDILGVIGGKSNVSFASHCATRLRLNLKDESIVDDEAVQAVDGVVGVRHAAGQYQIIIGTHVDRVYDEFIALTGGDKAAVVDIDDDGKDEQKRGVLGSILNIMSGIIMPVVPALTACGIVSAIATLLATFGAVDTTSGIYTLLYCMGNTCLYFFPVVIGGSAAAHFGMDKWLGCIIGAVLIYPTFVEMATAGTPLTLFGFDLTVSSYTSTVFPAIVAVWFASVIYKFLKKNLPQAVNFVFTPTLTLLVAAPISLFLIGPVVNWAGALISSASLAVYNFNPVLCGIILQPLLNLVLIPLGLHLTLVVVAVNNIALYGGDPILGLVCGAMTFVGVLLAFAIKTKNPEKRAMAYGAAVTAVFGISEPGLYGVVLQHKETMIATGVGAAVSAIFPAVFGTQQFVLGAGGILCFPNFVNPDGTMGSLIGCILCNVVGFVLGFLVTMLLYKGRTTEEEPAEGSLLAGLKK